ncbi:uncharacterized protein RCC_01082 [Ramularia collo-cygni]|uniref:DUF1772-domain-containing protein n=1 Tax=Ramularia collo-cygni TaxID=112498 RepID=A0A2D3UVZ5_9PEZI|nr:uncharacterized protein RCC_01082 [Ramularia collo-cygni]CZT15206.1 uncharacterized protein RCC_01082 [Ramularia collo-cygni]
MSSQSHNTLALKGFAITSTLAVATAMGSTSLLFIPSLLRPITKPARPSPSTNVSPMPSPTPSRQGSILNIPTLTSTDGRLTPQPSNDGRLTPQPGAGSGGFNFNWGTSGTYQAVAQQFSRLNTTAASIQVPLELLTIAAYGVVAYNGRKSGDSAWTYWATSAGIIASVFPFTGFSMAPLALKLARLAGDAEKVEPYEDAPIDREAEKSNTVEFLRKWNALNIARTVGVFAAGVVGITALVSE